MDFIKFNKSLFDLNFKPKNEILQLRNKNIHIAFNMNGCFGNVREMFFGVGNLKFTEFLYTNHFEVYCFETDKECKSYFETFKNEGVDINIHIGPEEVLFEKRNIRFTKTGKPKKDKIEEVLNPKLEEFFNMPKIDLTIMNPPYEHNLHLDILKIISKNSKRVINISPVKWKTSIAFIENTSQRKIIEEYSDIFANLQSLNIVGTCKSIFGTDDSSDIAIYEVYKSNRTHTAFEYISSKEDILTKKMLEKFKKNILDITTKTVQSKNFFRMPVIYGNEHQYWLKKICSDDFNRYWKKDVGEKHCKPYISFNTKNEGINFHKSLLTKTIRFVHYMCRHNSNVILNAIPWLEDYTKIWDDKRLCSYFGITGYIDDEHAKKDSEWEIILNTMKE